MKETNKFYWISLFNKHKRKNIYSLYDLLRIVPGMYLYICCVNQTLLQSNKVAEFILEEKKYGIVVVLVDAGGESTHAVSINLTVGRIYDYLKNSVFMLDHNNLSKYCGLDKVLKKSVCC